MCVHYHSSMKIILTIFLITSLINLSCAQNEKRDSSNVYQIADQGPEPIGGQEGMQRWIFQNVNRELLNRTDTLKCDSFRGGKVFVRYTINENGKLIQPKIEYGLGEPYDSEALRLITEMKINWIPGKKDGQNARVNTATAISFCSMGKTINKRKKRK